MRASTANTTQSETKAFVYHVAIPTCCLLVCAVFTGLFFSRITVVSQQFGSSFSSSFACYPNGDVLFPWDSVVNLYWDPSFFLTITLSAGRLSFSAVKAVDITWDLVVGRGGQMLLTALAYPVLRQALLSMMEGRPVRIPVVAQVAFKPDSLYTWWSITREICRRWSWRLFAFSWIIVYLLLFGTFVSAMTGYQANSQPYYRDRTSDNLMSLNNVRSVSAAILLDGSRVGLNDHYLVISNSTDNDRVLEDYDRISSRYCSNAVPFYTNGSANGTLTSVSETPQYRNYDSDLTTYSWNITWMATDTSLSPSMLRAYVYRYGGTGNEWAYLECRTSHITLGGRDWTLDAPALNFSHDLSSISPQLSQLSEVLVDQDGQLVDQTWLLQRSVSQCQPEATYQWGFSSLLLFCFCMASTIYAGLLLALHIDIWLRSRTVRLEQDFSVYRDILDLASVLQEHIGTKAEAMPARDLETSVKSHLDGITISTDDCPPSRSQEFGPRLRRTAKQTPLIVAVTKTFFSSPWSSSAKYTNVKVNEAC